MSTCSFYVILFVSHRKKKGRVYTSQIHRQWTRNKTSYRRFKNKLKILPSNLMTNELLTPPLQVQWPQSMPPQSKGILRPFSLVDAKCNTEQLTRKSCPIPDFGNKGISFLPTGQAHHTPVQGQHTSHVRWASLQVPEDNPCRRAESTEGTAWKLPLPDVIYRGHGFQRTVQHLLAEFNSKEKFNKAINTRSNVRIIIHSSIPLVLHENPSRFKKQTSSLCWFLRTSKAT